MPCTTILVGKKASYDGSTLIARNDDGAFDTKKLIVVTPDKQPKKYKSVIAHLEIELPEDPMSYTSCPNVDLKEGIWPAHGINEAGVAMTATETITSNARVLGADPLVVYKKAESKKEKDVPGGIGEEDLVTLVLPYIRSAREGVLRLGGLLEKYGTYEMNGIAFSDADEVWWLESIGGHHWIARRVKDEEIVIMPNQFGLDRFDFKDAFGAKKENLCSADMKEFVEKWHLDRGQDGAFDPRAAFGSRTDADHVYNTPRAWYMARYFMPRRYRWDGENADFGPESDDLPWSFVPEKKVTVDEIKYILSSYYQGTPYNPYSNVAAAEKGMYRPIGVANTGCMAILQIRGDKPEALRGIEWICFGANPFNAVMPVYTHVKKMPDWVSKVSTEVSTDNFYWCSRLIGVMADPHFGTAIQHVERYQNAMMTMGTKLINEYDAKMAENADEKTLEEANAKICAEARKLTLAAVGKVLGNAGEHMKVRYNRSDN